MDNLKKSKRVFIGIKVSQGVVELCESLKNKWSHPEFQWIHSEDLHLTLIPPWQMYKADLPQVEEKLTKAMKGLSPFKLQLQKVCLGPSLQNPRLLWITTSCPLELLALKKHLSEAFAPQETRVFLPHITLARFKMELPDKIRTNVNPEEQLNLEMKVNAVTLFESRSQEKVKYTVLNKFVFEER